MVESDKLTAGALKQHILRVHLQAHIWGQASLAQQVYLDPLENGYYKDENNQLKPTTTDIPTAPDPVIEMVRCQCKGNYSSK